MRRMGDGASRNAGMLATGLVALGLAALWLAGCNARGDPPKQAPPPTEVSVLRAQPRAVTLTRLG